MPCCSQEITDGRGVDVAIEALGKALTFSQCAKSVRDGGKAVMIGLAAVNVMGEVDITRLVRRQVSIGWLPPLYCIACMVPCSSSHVYLEPGENHWFIWRKGQARSSSDSEARGEWRLQSPEHHIKEMQD
jgi:NADPH:quinone reductase-like Zn-dependent oxidoreductase